MARPVFNTTIVDQGMNIQPGALVYVYTKGTTDLIPLFEFSTGLASVNNPFMADTEGFVQFYAEEGTYDFKAAYQGGETLFVVDMVPPEEVDALAYYSRPVTASEPLGGHRVVTSDGFHCTETTLDKLAGITLAAASQGALAPIQTSGYMTEPSWSWTANAPIFVGSTGTLTQTVPSGSFARRVAWATSPTEINIDLFPLIQLA